MKGQYGVLERALKKSIGKSDYIPKIGRKVTREVYETLKEILVPGAYELDIEEILPRAKIMEDLCADSLDILDIEGTIRERMENSFDISSSYSNNQEQQQTVCGLMEIVYKGVAAKKVFA